MLKKGFKQLLAEASAVVTSVSVQDLDYFMEAPDVALIDVRDTGRARGRRHDTRFFSRSAGHDGISCRSGQSGLRRGAFPGTPSPSILWYRRPVPARCKNSLGHGLPGRIFSCRRLCRLASKARLARSSAGEDRFSDLQVTGSGPLQDRSLPFMTFSGLRLPKLTSPTPTNTTAIAAHSHALVVSPCIATPQPTPVRVVI